MGERIGFDLYQSCGNRGSVGRVSVFGLRNCGLCREECVGGLGQGMGGWDCVMSVCAVSLDYFSRWKVHISVHCAIRITAHLR